MPKRVRLPKWMRELRVGDVLWNKNRTDARVVRYVSYDEVKQRLCVAMTIRRCSWTNSPLTVLNANDLKQRRYKPAGFRKRLNKSIDKKLAREVKVFYPWDRKIDCCDVKGVP